MSRSTRCVAPLLACALLFTSCKSLDMSRGEFLHTLSVNQDGTAVPVEVGGAGEDGEAGAHGERSADLRAHVEDIVTSVKRDFEQSDKASYRVVLIIHGGLVSAGSALESARDTLGEMGCEDFYPIFVNWETGMGKSYSNHLFAIRGGRKRRTLALLSSPLYLIADLGRALTRLPVTYTIQGYKGALATLYSSDLVETPEGWEGSAALSDSDEKASFGEKAVRVTQAVVPGVARIATTFLLDAVGRSAFVNMQRRARVLFLLDGDIDKKERKQSGALSLLMDGLRDLNAYNAEELEVQRIEAELRDWQRALIAVQRRDARHDTVKDPETCTDCREELQIQEQLDLLADELLEATPFRVTVIAHSMGTIVANELVRRNSNFVFDEIVFMGAACTIKEFADTTLVYVKEHPTTRFYNLSLHPVDEVNERSAYGALPFGSLLEWIDSYISDRRSDLDGTLGKWNNIAKTLPVIDYLTSDVRRRIVVKGFGRSDDVPRKHGQFNDTRFRFWERSFWELDGEHVVRAVEPETIPLYDCAHAHAWSN